MYYIHFTDLNKIRRFTFGAFTVGIKRFNIIVLKDMIKNQAHTKYFT